MVETGESGVGLRKLASGTAMLFVARILATVFGLGQAILLAKKFGTSVGTDAFFVAWALCRFFSGPAETSLNQGFVPTFVHEVETEGDAAGWYIAAGLFRLGLIVLGLVALLLALSSPGLALVLAPGFDGEAIDLVALMIRTMAAVIPFTFVASFLSTMEYIEGRQALPALGIVLSAAAGPVSLLLFADRFGVMALACGLVVGAAARCVVLSLGSAHLLRLVRPGLRWGDERLRSFGSVISARVLASWFLNVNLMVDRAFASLLGPGLISALSYASQAVMAIVRVFVMPLGRTLLPAFSRLAARDRRERMRRLMEQLVIGIASLILPLVGFLVIFRDELLGLVFLRGAFEVTALAATSDALLFYSLGIVAFLLVPVLSGAFFALQNTAVPVKVGLVCVVANALLDAGLILLMGHAGIALATSLVATLRALLLWIFLRSRLGRFRSKRVALSLAISLGATAVSFWCARLVLAGLGATNGAALWPLLGVAVVGSALYMGLQATLNRPVSRLIRRAMAATK